MCKISWNGLQSERVFFWFCQLCAIPHGSGNTKQISDFCVNFAVERGLEWEQDPWNNVIIMKEASAGYETAPALLLQGHLDMVCEKEQGSSFDFTKDPLELARKGDDLFAKGTTLGGDDGIAVAVMLALLESDTIAHPRLEAVFTTDEETGMTGAQNIDLSRLTATRMINLDSEQEGVFTVGCAGGGHVNWHLPGEWKQETGELAVLEISGLTGGHSGMEIGREGASAVSLLGKLLFALGQNFSFRILSVSGGTQSNAIPIFARAQLLFLQPETEEIQRILAQLKQDWLRSYGATDPQLNLTMTWEGRREEMCLTKDCGERLIFLLYHYPYGVISRDTALGGMVKTSLNLGILRTEQEQIEGVFCVRSNVEAEKKDLVNHLISMTEYFGGTVEREGDYPAWERQKESKLQELMTKTYRDINGREPVIETIHAGLECGFFADKIPGLDCVSVGPNIFEIHTVRERLSVSSVERLWIFLLEVLKRGF